MQTPEDEPPAPRRRKKQWVMPDGRPSDVPPDEEPGVRMRRRARLAIAALGVYFAMSSAPAFHTPLIRSPAWWLYMLSVPLVLLALLVGGVAALVARRRAGEGASWHAWHGPLLAISVAGFALFLVSLVLLSIVRHGQPLGSYAARFDGEVWRLPSSAEPVHGDLSPRQKMVGDLIDNVLPGRTRDEIVALLGPVAETTYLDGTGRDILYPLGLERGPIAMDSEWLLIWLDGDGRFDAAAVMND